MQGFTEREKIVEVINKLFIYTDHQYWDKLQNDVFTKFVHLDMTSMRGEAKEMLANQICKIWEKGMENLDAVNHLGGNYLITINGQKASAFAYSTTTHYKKSAKNGNTRDFIGTYNLELVKEQLHWRISKIKYNLRYISGNLNLK